MSGPRFKSIQKVPQRPDDRTVRNTLNDLRYNMQQIIEKGGLTSDQFSTLYAGIPDSQLRESISSPALERQDPPGKPTGLSGIGGVYYNTVTWAQPGESDTAIRWNVYVSTSAVFAGSSLAGTTATTMFAHTPSDAAEDHYYWVQALNSNGVTSGLAGPVGPLVVTGDAAQLIVVNYAALRNIPGPANGAIALVVDDDQYGHFVFDSSSTEVDDGGVFIAPNDATAGCWVRVYGDTCEAHWWGASPAETEANNKTFLQQAVDTCARIGRTLHIRGGHYKINWPIHFRSYSRVIGDGLHTLIHNTNLTSDRGDGLCFTFGTLGGNANATGLINDRVLDDVLAEDERVFLSTPSEAANYKAGDILMLFSINGYITKAGFLKSAYQQITEVLEDGNPTTGEVVLRDNIYKDMTQMRICKSGDSVLPAPDANYNNKFEHEIIGYAYCGHLAVRSEVDSWTRYGGMYRSLIENIDVLRSANIWACNGTAWSTVRSVRGNVWIRSIELAHYCHNSLIDDFKILLYEGATPTQDLGIIAFGEGSHGNRVTNINIDYRDDAVAGKVVKFGQGSYRNEVDGLKARIGQIAQFIDGDNAKAADGMEYGTNIVRNVEAEVGLFTTRSMVFTAANDTDEVGVRMENIKLKATLGAGLFNFACSGIQMRNCDFSECTGDPPMTVAAGAQNVAITNNKFPPGSANLLDNWPATVENFGNSVKGRESFESFVMTYNNGTAIADLQDGGTPDNNNLTQRTILADTLEEGDGFEFEIGGSLTGVNNHTINIHYNGEDLYRFATQAEGDFHIRGQIHVINSTPDSWRGVAQEQVDDGVTPLATVSRYIKTAAVTADNDVKVRAYVANVASSIFIDFLTIRPIKRY